MYPFSSSPPTPQIPIDPAKLDLHPNESLTYKLSSSRTLGYASYGSNLPSSPTIFLFHGMPGSRICGRSWDYLCKRIGARLIAIDRPGCGLSSYSDRKLVEWPADVVSLADHLSIENFGIIGASAGGPFALACARFIPRERLRVTTVVCGIGPLDAIVSHVPRFLRGMAKWVVGVVARYFVLPRILAPYQTGDPGELKKVLEDQCVTAEEKALAHDDSRETNLDDAVLQFMEAFKRGPEGARLDGKILTSDWGFDVRDIDEKAKVRLIHGDQDAIAPLKYAEWIDERMGGGRLEVIRGMTHSPIWKECEENIFRRSREI
jgi:pimeloyl-ACP methyl ester carboxylesterase